ncbi:MAG: CHASE2 domain-containing protein [Desulforhopalus sp.]
MNLGIEGLRLLSDNKRFARQALLSSFLLIILLSGLYLFNPRTIDILNLKITDIILTSADSSKPKLEIVTVAIDDASLEKYGQWPWPRFRIAQLLEKITAEGAESVGINIIFSEKDRTSPKLWQENLKEDFGYVIETSDIPIEILDYDIYLANTLRKGSYVIGYSFLFNDSLTHSEKCALRPVSLVQGGAKDTSPLATHFHKASGIVCNYETLADATSGSGFLNGTPDIDGVLRRSPLLIEYKDKLYPSFALAVLMQYRHHNVLVAKADKNRIPHLSLADFNIPIDENGNFLLGSAKNIQSKQYSAREVLEEKIQPGLFKDKIVLVGLTAAGLKQEYPTPFAPATPLLDIHRNAIESLTSGFYTIRTIHFSVWEAMFSLLLCLLLVVCVVYLPTTAAVIFCLLAICFSWSAAALIYQNMGYLFSPLLPTLSLALGSCLLLILKFNYFQKQAKTKTRDTLLLLDSSETNLQSILKTIPDIIFRLDSNDNFSFISPAISKYLKSPEALLGRPIFELVAPEDLEKTRYRLNERRTGDRAAFDLEIRLLLCRNNDVKQDSRRYFSLSAEAIYSKNNGSPNRYMGTQGIFRDITYRKSLENQLMQAQKMEVIGSLAAGIAHDLNNILSGLVSYPDILLMEIPKDDPMHKKIQLIQRSGKKAAIIVQDLLTLARLGVTVDEICNLNDIITEYLESFEFQSIRKRHQHTAIHTSLQDNLLNVKGSAVHLSKVIMNLLNNSLEAMPAGGDITISTTNLYIDTHISGFEHIPEGEYICVSVADSGVGISERDLKQIFEPFYTKKSMNLSGTGLGMTIVWATIKDHKGYIDIQSKEGRGTTFKLYLPTTRENVKDQQQRLVLNDYIGFETILVVDDIPEQLDIAKNMLTKLGYTVHSASSGENAIELIARQPVDLVVLDMIMPGGLDGLKTYQEIIRLYPRQKAIITSGFSESDRVKKLLSLGVGDYVQKPYSLERLGIAVRRELDREVNL